jgi:hypothetical protein
MTAKFYALPALVFFAFALQFVWLDAAQAQPAEEEEDGVESSEAEEEGAEAAPEPEEPPEPVVDEVSITRELRTVEQNVNVLKERVFRSKARLLLLEEKVIRGVVAGAKARLIHVNRLGGAYRIESISYYFDGTPIFEKVDSTTEFHRKKELKIFEGNIPPGSHTITANIVVKGNGSGAFSYLDDYSFKGQESYSFIAEDNKTAVIRMVLRKKGGPLGGFEEGPEMSFEQEDVPNLPGAEEPS